MKVILKKLLCIVLALTTVFSGLVFTSSAAETKESSVIPVNSVIDYAFRGILKLVWLISDYEYDAIGTSGMLKKGEKGTLTLNYRGADNMPESETVEFTAYEPLQLPTLTKKGYHFVGWVYSSACIGTEITLNRDNASIYPFFEKDYTAIQSPVALFTDEFEYTEYSVGEYSDVNIKTTEIFVESGYTVTVFERKNFKGKSKTIAYTEYYEGKVGSMKITETKSEGIEVDALTDDVKAELLKTFAPRIWWDENEEYYACTVEDAKANMSRVMSNIGYVYVIEDLDNPFYMNDYLYGSKTDAKAYAFAVEKEFEYLDLTYFIFTPYNKAKRILTIEFGNHIGDWEHVAVRLKPYTENGKTYYKPVVVEYSAHSTRTYYSWEDVQKVDNTHFVAYTAQGSHGMWKDAGTHVYVNAYVTQLTDECSEGYAWDLWENDAIETYSYDSLTQTGKGIGNSEWNTCFDVDFYNENSDSVGRWGNRGWNAPAQIYANLSNAPGGPQYKQVIFNYYSFNDKQ